MSNTLTSSELKTLIDGKTGFVLLDVREPQEYQESYIANSKLIPLGELSDRARTELEVSKPIIVYCAHGMRSLQGLMILKQLGFENVRSLEGGICEWEEQFDVVREG